MRIQTDGRGGIPDRSTRPHESGQTCNLLHTLGISKYVYPKPRTNPETHVHAYTYTHTFLHPFLNITYGKRIHHFDKSPGDLDLPLSTSHLTMIHAGHTCSSPGAWPLWTGVSLVSLSTFMNRCAPRVSSGVLIEDDRDTPVHKRPYSLHVPVLHKDHHWVLQFQSFLERYEIVGLKCRVLPGVFPVVIWSLPINRRNNESYAVPTVLPPNRWVNASGAPYHLPRPPLSRPAPPPLLYARTCA